MKFFIRNYLQQKEEARKVGLGLETTESYLKEICRCFYSNVRQASAYGMRFRVENISFKYKSIIDVKSLSYTCMKGIWAVITMVTMGRNTLLKGKALYE
jgi:hypothetical protein